MKKWTFLFFGMLLFNMTLWAGNDKPIQVTEMPKAAQQFIKNHFPNQSVAMAKMEKEFMDKNYDVVFTDGSKLEFDKKGHWTKVDCGRREVPQAVVPVAIRKYVSQNYPDAKVQAIELTDRKGYEVELSNGFEIKFDKRMNVIDIDR